MTYFRITQFENNKKKLYGVEFTENNGRSWMTFSVHTTYDSANKQMRGYVSIHRNECDYWEESNH